MKTKEQVLDFKLKLKNRVKDGLSIAEKAARLAEQFGRATEDGYVYNFHNSTVKLIYDTLDNTLFVDSGNQFLFKSNLKLKTVSVFRNGTWANLVNEEYKKKIVDANIEDEDFVNMHSSFVQEIMGVN